MWLYCFNYVCIIDGYFVVVIVREQEAAVSITAEGSYSSLAAQVSECLARTVTGDVIRFKTVRKLALTSGQSLDWSPRLGRHCAYNAPQKPKF